MLDWIFGQPYDGEESDKESMADVNVSPKSSNASIDSALEPGFKFEMGANFMWALKRILIPPNVSYKEKKFQYLNKNFNLENYGTRPSPQTITLRSN